LALASSRDQYHDRAVDIESRFRSAGGRWVGSVLVLAELHGHLLRRRDAVMAQQVVSALLLDAAFEWHDATVELMNGAIEAWIGRYRGHRFSLTDAVTFELMRRQRLTRAFAFDSDFQTAGFVLLD
jgi:predicted nucleic acid-binding protein